MKKTTLPAKFKDLDQTVDKVLAFRPPKTAKKPKAPKEEPITRKRAAD